MHNFFNLTSNQLTSLTPEGKHFLPPQFHTFMNNCGDHWCVDIATHGGQIFAYKSCAPLSLVINRLAFALGNARIWVVDEDEKDLEEYGWIKRLFIKPNPLMTGRELLLRLDQYVKLFGEGFVLKIENEGIGDPIRSLWVLNPCYMHAIYRDDAIVFNSEDVNDFILRWEYIHPYSGQIINLNPNDILHVKDIALDMHDVNAGVGSFKHWHRGASRIQGLEDYIKNIVIAAKAIYGLNLDRGPQGILSPTSVDAAGAKPLTPGQKTDLQKELLRFYGMLPGVAKAIISTLPMSWTPMSYNVKDLMLYEGMELCANGIADAYFFPSELISTGKSATYNNKSQAEKNLYQDAILPVSYLYEQHFTNFLGIEGGRINFDYSHVEALQESEKEKEETITIRTNRMITLLNNGLSSNEEVRLAAGLSEDFTPQNNNTNEN